MERNVVAVAVAVGLCVGTSVFAGPINITINDGQNGTIQNPNGATSPWAGSPGLGAGHEDNETEPGTITGDQWDLEAFAYNYPSSSLSLIGTYDFKNGEVHNGINYSSGAIFVRTPGNSAWNYAYVLNFNNNTYTLYNNFTTINPSDIPASTPWSINTATANALGTGSFGYTTGILDPLGFGLQRASGTGHNEIDLDLGLLPGELQDSFDVHFTMSCGNDDLEGHYTTTAVPDGGATAGLLGVATLSLILVRRKLVLA
jgi:hypothetical protein